MSAAPPSPGTEFVTAGRTITETDLVSFSALTGDWHPQHSDAAWAAGSHFGQRVAHGMLLLSYAVGLVPFDPQSVVALRGLDSVKFKRPAGIGDTIRVESTVKDVKGLDDEHSLVRFVWRILNQDDLLLARLSIDALWRQRSEAASAPAGHSAPAARVEDLYGDRILL